MRLFLFFVACRTKNQYGGSSVNRVLKSSGKNFQPRYVSSPSGSVIEVSLGFHSLRVNAFPIHLSSPNCVHLSDQGANYYLEADLYR